MATNVPCDSLPSCRTPSGDPITGDVNFPRSCAEFVQCVNGVQRGSFSCGSLHFNPRTGTCDWPINLQPRCVDYPTANHAEPDGQPGEEESSLPVKTLEEFLDAPWEVLGDK